MITKLSLENFKSWQKAELDFGRLTFLFGTNSSGKSSILYALLALKQTTEGSDRERSFNFGGTERDYVDLGSYRDVVFRHEEKQAISVGLHWRLFEPVLLAPEILDTKPIDFDQHGSPIYSTLASEIGTEMMSYIIQWDTVQGLVMIRKLIYGISEENDLLVVDRLGDSDKYRYGCPHVSPPSPIFPAPGSCYEIPLEVSRFYMDFRDLELQTFNYQFEALVKRIHYLGPLREHPKRTYIWTGAAPQVLGKRGEWTIDALITANRRDAALVRQVSKWLNNMGLVETLDIQSIDSDKRFYEPRIGMFDTRMEDSLIDVGFGISQVLPVIVILHFVPEGSIVLLEQPELHLHPSAQAELADMFLQVAHERNLQLIVESHSEHLLVRLQRRIAEAEHPLANPENIRLYFCEIGPEGSQARKVETNRFGQIRDWPENFFGDRAAELDAMTIAALERRRQELSGDGDGE